MKINHLINAAAWSRQAGVFTASTALHRIRGRAFTLLELLVVMGLVAMLSLVLLGGIRQHGKATALQSAQALLANLATAARTQALTSGQSCRILIHVDPLTTSEPNRYLRYVVLQLQTAAGWQVISDSFLPEGVYVVPGNFSVMPGGLFATSSTVPWAKIDGSDLRSTALRANQITVEAVDDASVEQWVGITLSANAGTLQSGDIILAAGRRRPPGSYVPGDAPIELENPADVRGLTLSAYGVPALINTRTSF